MSAVLQDSVDCLLLVFVVFFVWAESLFFCTTEAPRSLILYKLSMYPNSGRYARLELGIKNYSRKGDPKKGSLT